MTEAGDRVKVLHVIPSVTPKNGGPSEAIVRITSALRDFEIECMVLTSDYHGRGERFSEHERAAIAARVGRVHVARKWWDAYTFAPGILLWLLRHGRQFDVLHIHALFSFSSTVSAVYAILSRRPFVVRPLGTLAPYGLSARRERLKRLSIVVIEGPMLKRARAVHCTSNAERDDVLTVCKSANAVVVPLSVDVSAVKLGEVPDNIDGNESARPLRILYLSRLDQKKNVEVLLDAFANLSPVGSNVELVIAGDGETNYVASLKKHADKRGVPHRVRWLGHVTGEEKARAFRTADVFVLPSQSENFGIAVAEALAAGLPCVVSPGVAIAPDIERYGAGLVVPSEPIALANALTSLLEQPAQRAACSRAARQLAQDEYSDEKLGMRLLNLYETILAGSPARPSR